jgi:hypothetical protein
MADRKPMTCEAGANEAMADRKPMTCEAATDKMRAARHATTESHLGSHICSAEH